jgi:hypothetical protein
LRDRDHGGGKQLRNPLLSVSSNEAVVSPSGIVAHVGDADEKIDVAHDLGERERRNIGERDRSGVAGATEAHDQWSAYTEYSDGLGGSNFRAALEYRFGAIELRGAGRYSQGHWYPSAGAGFNLTRNFGVDAGLFGTRTFLEAHPQVGLAISLRFDAR